MFKNIITISLVFLNITSCVTTPYNAPNYLVTVQKTENIFLDNCKAFQDGSYTEHYFLFEEIQLNKLVNHLNQDKLYKIHEENYNVFSHLIFLVVKYFTTYTFKKYQIHECEILSKDEKRKFGESIVENPKIVLETFNDLLKSFPEKNKGRNIFGLFRSTRNDPSLVLNEFGDKAPGELYQFPQIFKINKSNPKRDEIFTKDFEQGEDKPVLKTLRKEIYSLHGYVLKGKNKKKHLFITVPQAIEITDQELNNIRNTVVK